MKKNTLIIIGALALIVITFVSVKFSKPPVKIEKILPIKEVSQEAGVVKKAGFKPAPEFLLKDAAGAEKKLSDFKGKVVIIDFWATWCPPCREEIPHFVELYNEYKSRGLEIIGISMDQNPERVIPSFMERNNINYTILFGEEDVYDSYGGINAIPTTFIVDKNGDIRKKYIGYNEKEVFERDMKELL